MNDRAVPSIVVEKMHKKFGSIEILKGISLTANEGDIISLIGASGSGKTTLLRCINLLDVPDSGHVYIRGELIRMTINRHGDTVPESQKQVDHLRQRLGMVFQQFNLWTHMTILENIIEAPVHVLKKTRKESIELAMNLLEKVGIADKAKFYPAHLSGGQQQRAAIARVLAMEPDAILFDEPTSALDPELVGEVLEVIEKLAAEKRTMIIATHEMGFARDVSSTVMFLHQGVIEEQGTPENFFKNPSSQRCRQFLGEFYNGTSV